MAFFTGTASNYLDLMDKVKGHVTGAGMGSQAWTCLRDRVNSDSTRELIFRAPGLQGQDQIFTGIKSFFSTVNDYYNWILDGFIGFDDSLEFDQQPGSILMDNSQGLGPSRIYRPQLPMWNQSMPYWLAANGRRMVLIVKVSTRYEAMYLGLLKPYGSPGQLSYPLVVGGSLTGEAGGYKYTQSTVNHRHFVDPAHFDTDIAWGIDGIVGPSSSKAVQGVLRYRGTAGCWHGSANSRFSSSNVRMYGGVGFGPKAKYCSTWPYATYNNEWYVSTPLLLMMPNLDGTYPLFPIMLIDAVPKQLAGELDGVFAVPGTSNSPESVITIGSDNYFVVCNVADLNSDSFWCLKME